MTSSRDQIGKRDRKFSGATKRLQRRIRLVPPYKVIAVGVYDDQATSLDRTAAGLQQAGHLKANRSFVVQALVRRLQREIEGLTSEQLLQMFFDNYLKRPLSKAPAREKSDRVEESSSRSTARRRRPHSSSP